MLAFSLSLSLSRSCIICLIFMYVVLFFFFFFFFSVALNRDGMRNETRSAAFYEQTTFYCTTRFWLCLNIVLCEVIVYAFFFWVFAWRRLIIKVAIPAIAVILSSIIAPFIGHANDYMHSDSHKQLLFSYHVFFHLNCWLLGGFFCLDTQGKTVLKGS